MEKLTVIGKLARKLNGWFHLLTNKYFIKNQVAFGYFKFWVYMFLYFLIAIRDSEFNGEDQYGGIVLAIFLAFVFVMRK